METLHALATGDACIRAIKQEFGQGPHVETSDHWAGASRID